MPRRARSFRCSLQQPVCQSAVGHKINENRPFLAHFENWNQVRKVPDILRQVLNDGLWQVTTLYSVGPGNDVSEPVEREATEHFPISDCQFPISAERLHLVFSKSAIGNRKLEMH